MAINAAKQIPGSFTPDIPASGVIRISFSPYHSPDPSTQARDPVRIFRQGWFFIPIAGDNITVLRLSQGSEKGIRERLFAS
jgi:hypothetical protein